MATTLHPSSPVLLLLTTQNAKNSSSHNHLLPNCKTLNELKQLHCNMKKKGLSHNPSNINKLIVACVQIGTHESLNYALNAFKEEEEEEEGTMCCSLYTCNTLIRGFASSGLGQEAIFIYLHMIVVMGVVPDKFTFSFLLSACSKIMVFSEGVQVLGVIFKMGLEKDLFVANSLIHFYAECGKVDSGERSLIKCLRNVVSCTSLINGYSGVNMVKEVCLYSLTPMLYGLT